MSDPESYLLGELESAGEELGHLEAERDELLGRIANLEAALRDIYQWGVSVPLGMTEAEYNTGTLRDIKRWAYAALEISA